MPLTDVVLKIVQKIMVDVLPCCSHSLGHRLMGPEGAVHLNERLVLCCHTVQSEAALIVRKALRKDAALAFRWGALPRPVTLRTPFSNNQYVICTTPDEP